MELIHDELCDKIIASAKKIAQEKKAGKIAVRDILKDLNITNRVFYNRFKNIDEVFEILYTQTISKVRESLSISWDADTDFGEHILNVAAKTLTLSYASRKHYSSYIFEADSMTNANFDWWILEIKKLIVTGKEIKYFKPELNEEAISYSLWCFIRGFNADAIGRGLKEEEALSQFKYGISCFFEGMRA